MMFAMAQRRAGALGAPVRLRRAAGDFSISAFVLMRQQVRLDLVDRVHRHLTTISTEVPPK
jgi:hypothetical protein